MSNEPLNIEINALKRFKELSAIEDQTQVVRLAGECSEFIFKSVCIRLFNKQENDYDIREPLQFLNKKEDDGGVNFFYKKDEKGKTNSKLIRIQGLSRSIAPLANLVKHTGDNSLPNEANTQKAIISEIIVWYFTDISNYQHLNIDQQDKQLITNALNLIPSNIPSNLEIITSDTFQRENFSDEKSLNQLTIDYFLKFNNNPNNLKRVIANDIHIIPDETFNIRVESEDEQISANDIISKASIGQPVLLKIMAVGGVGKSTLLWHLIKQLSTDYKTFFLKRADPDCIKYIFQELVTASKVPVLLFLDDVVSYEENKENLVRFGEAISEFASVAPIILFASERGYRYDKFKGKKEFEKNFPTELTVHYSNNSIREQVFEKIFQSLNLNNEIVSTDVKNHCKSVFNQHKFESIIDSTFNLIVYLKKDFPNINYRFDWEDWNEACTDKFEVLNELFKIIAFFYQFGIQVPIDFLKDHFAEVRNVKDLLRELLGNFQEMYSPIVSISTDNGEESLALRHEKLGEWYFQIIPQGESSAKDFFKDFLSNVKSRSASYLFRNISRKNSDFQFSSYSKQLPNDKILKIINSYLLNINESDYEEEEYKMLMEKHFVLLNLGKDIEANEPLEKIIQLNRKNVFALVRLAYYVKHSDFERAEKLFKEALNLEPQNSYPLIELFILYYQYPELKQFENFQVEKVFPYAKENLRFANMLLQYIERNFQRLPVSTISNLHDLYATHKVLGNDIAELLMVKGAFKDSFTVLEKLKSDAELLSRKYRSKTIHLLIKLYKVQNSTDDKSLKTAKEILNEYYKNEELNSEANFFYAQILSLNKKNSDFKRAETFFKKAFEQDKSTKNFFAITRFYREYATHIIDKENSNLPKAIIVFLKGINHVRDRIKTLITNKTPYEIELCIFLNEIVQAYFFHASKLDDSSKKYINLISSIENETEKLLEKCLTELSKKLPNPSASSFSNYLIDEDDLQLYSKACSVSYDFYSSKVARINKDNSSPTESLQYLTKVKEILNKALAFDEDNPRLIINLIDTKIKLNETDIASRVEKIDFVEFTIKQKARLSRLLIQKGQKDLGIKLIYKFGQLNSTDIKVKNDLAICYIEARLWNYAIKVFSDLKKANDYTLIILRRLALELPTNSEERANAKIALSKEYLKRSKDYIRVIKRNICMTFFVTGKTSESFKYYQNNRFHIDTDITKALNVRAAFAELCKEWQNEFIGNLAKSISVAETIVDKQGRYDDGLEIITQILDNLLSLKYDFDSIIYNFKNDDPQREKIKTIIIKSINILFKVIESKTALTDKAVEQSNSIIKYYKNKLFNKVFVNKLIRNESKLIAYKFAETLEWIENYHKSEPDIVRMLGRYYTMKGAFPKAKGLFNKGLNLPQNDTQLCYLHNNLADWIMIQIEKKGLKSFGNENAIKNKIKEAEKHINKCKELVPTFQYYDASMERLDALKQKYIANE